MNKRVVITVLALLAVIIGSGLYVLVAREPSGTEPTPQKSQSTTTPNTSDDSPTPPANSAGNYISYSEEAFNSADGTRLLFFHAPWCPQCRELDESIAAITLPANVTIYKVDYDTRQDLRQKYGVTIQTTVVKVDADDNKIDSFVAYDNPSYASIDDNLLKQ